MIHTLNKIKTYLDKISSICHYFVFLEQSHGLRIDTKSSMLLLRSEGSRKECTLIVAKRNIIIAFEEAK
jgi:hypothetical protein